MYIYIYIITWFNFSIWVKHSDHILKLQLSWLDYNLRDARMEYVWDQKAKIWWAVFVAWLEAPEWRVDKWSAQMIEMGSIKVKKKKKKY